MSDANILLVDDSEALRNVVKIYLMGLQRPFLEAADGREGLELLQRHEVALIIVGLALDGFAFCQKVRARSDERLRDVPIILLTGEKTELLRQRSEEVGANDLLVKPVTAAELQSSVRRLLSPES